MHDSDRGNEPATLGAFGYFAAIVLCCLIVGGLTYGLGRENERRYETPASYAKAAKADAQSTCAGREGAAAFECVYEKVEAAQEQARGEQDLSAQQKAANASLLSAIIAFATLILSAVGVWFIKRTLDATLEAVEDTGLATAAMVKQNEIAKEVHRPWVTISVDAKKFLAGSSYHFDTEFTFHNVGDTAALNLNFVAEVILESPETDGDFWKSFESAEPKAPESKVCVVPRDKYTYQTSVLVEEEHIRYWADPNIINPVMIITAFYKSDSEQVDWHKAIRAYRWTKRGGGSLTVGGTTIIDGKDFLLRTVGGHIAT